MKRISRRGALLRLASLGAGCLLPGVLAAAEARSYKGVTYLPPSYRALMFGIQGFVKRLKAAAGESMRVEFFDSGSLMKADAQVDALQVGSIQFMFHTTSYITEEFPILSIIGMPGVCDQLHLHGDRLAMDSPLWRLINDSLGRRNLYMLTAGGGVIEPEYIWSGAARVASLEDLAGKRVRVVSHEATEMVKNFGGEPVRVPSSRMYLMLQRGALDAVVANISTIFGRNLHEQLSLCYRMPVTAYSIAVFLLKDVWQNLPGPHRDAFMQAGGWYDANSASTINNEIYPHELWPEMKEADIEIVDPSAEETTLFADRAKPVWAWWRERVGPVQADRAIDLALGRA
jgi:TRAP-type C4-dicarboxylate transport system substrate-binding protein